MKAKKILQVIAYDIEDDKTRDKIVKILEKYGSRVNFSVFECMFSSSELTQTKDKIEKLMDKTSDSIVFYPICVNCYTKAMYLPGKKNEFSTVKIV